MSKEVTLCPRCVGRKTVFEAPPDLDWRNDAARCACRKTCPACEGIGLTDEIKGDALTFQIRAESIFGSRVTSARLRRGVSTPGFDLWLDGKKRTRGRKYLNAENLSDAVRQLLMPSELRYVGTAILS